MFIIFDIRNAIRTLLIIIASAAVIIGLIFITAGNDEADVFGDFSDNVLVIDAGHGGIDGGAVSAEGVKESDINLSIALKTEAVSNLFGVKTLMTRSTDTDFSNGDYSERSNLLCRAEAANKTPGAILLSIHQNTFPTQNVCGAEVMYAKTDGSDLLGIMMQDKLVSFADPSNRRVAMPAPDKLLLTSSVNCPAVLVECGFLSNPDEASLLCTDEYQTKLALAFTATFLEYTQTITA